MSAHQCIFSALPKNACDPHTELASFMLLVLPSSAFFPPVCALPYWIWNIIINYCVVAIAMIAVINFILVPLWSLCSPPVSFSVRSHGRQEKLLWHFQAATATWSFRECKIFLSTSATAWACTGWASGILRPGCRMAWAGTRCLGTGRWAGHMGAVPISILWKDPVVFDTECESFGHQGMLRSFQAPTQQCAKPNCTSQWGPDAELVMAERGSNYLWETKQSQLCDYPGSSQGLYDGHGRAQQELSLVCSQG